MSVKALIDHQNAVNLVIDRMGFGTYQIRSLIIISLGSFALGSNFSVMTTLPFILSKLWNLEHFQLSLLSGFFISASFAVNLLMVVYGDKIGRLKFLNIAFFVHFLSAVCSALSPEIYSEIFFRFINGFSLMLAITSATPYMVETSPTKIRGAISVSYWFIQSLGELWSVLLFFVFNRNLDQDNWREISVIAAVPGLLSLIGNIYFLKESPLFLIRKNNYQEGIEVLDYMCSINNTEKCSEIEKEEILQMDSSTKSSFNFKQLFKRKLLFKHVHVSFLWIFVVFGFYGIYFVFPFLVSMESGRDNVVIVVMMCTGIQALINIILVVLVEMKCLGRKKTLILCAIFSLLGSVFALVYSSGFMFYLGTSMIYGFYGGMFSVLFPYTAELYNTKVRTSSLALVNTISRVISSWSPGVFLAIMKFSPECVYYSMIGASVWIIIVLVVLLEDTKDKVLDRSFDSRK